MRRLGGIFLLGVAALGAADLPRIVYSKSFPASNPPYVEIVVDSAGHGLYKEAKDDDSPVEFQLAPDEAGAIFGLAARLDHFSKPLESPLKVAFMGEKTLRWENGAEKREVKFNYSANADAMSLWDWFERIVESEQRFAELDNASHFDKLGVNQAVLDLEASLDRKRLVALTQFLPLLDRVAGSERYMHMARERAAALADQIRNPAPKAHAQ
jgi:hypothetical protein